MTPEKTIRRWTAFVRGNVAGQYQNPAEYESHMREQFAREAIGQELAGLVARHSGEQPQILELAAGTGIVTEQLSKIGTVVATDLSPDQLEYNQNQGRARGGYVLANLNQQLPFQSGSFDVVTSYAANRYFSSEGFLQFLAESFRVLKSDGTLVLPLIPSDHVLWRLMSKNILQPTTVKGVVPLMQEAGFEVAEVVTSKVDRSSHVLKALPTYVVAKKPDR